MANVSSLPNLHDGYFDGVWLSDNKRACLFVRTVGEERSTILLTDVATLNIRNLRQGNIIFDVVITASHALTVSDIEQAYDLKSEDEDKAQKLLNKARQEGLSALAISSSYGAEGDVLFRNIEVAPGHVLANSTWT